MTEAKWMVKHEAKAPKSSRNSNTISTAVQNVVLPMLLITKESELQSFLDKNNNSFGPSGKTCVGVHFQFAGPYVDQNEPDQVVAIAISSCAPDEVAVLVLLASLSKSRVITGLKRLLEDFSVSKVMHNIHRVAFWLHSFGLERPTLAKCVDLQLLFESTVDKTVMNATILQIVNCCSPDMATKFAQTAYSYKAKIDPLRSRKWTSGPLSKKLQQALVQSAQLYASCYTDSQAKPSVKVNCATMTSDRWKFAITNQGHPAIWFDPEHYYQPRSLECLVSTAADNSTVIPAPKLELECELEPLLNLLPASFKDAILALNNYHDLIDICIDTGRVPFAYTGKKQRVVLSKDGATVSKDTIAEILTNLGGEMRIGSDNRAGIDRQLHRISVMRSKTDEVFGLTMRVGRALRNAACVLTDLLLSEHHANKSVLVLGHPGSGKTTLIRDVARCVSDTMENVCIIDTSNEIGGDGLVPHACVGWARRMMVRSLEAQAGVMIECVQNHTVETLIVDEIGRKAEVLAASTVRQRGPRLIASAHGDFRALIKNPDLKGLVGGSQQVTVGDAEAKASHKSKLQIQRAGNPIFDVIVELDHVIRGRCRIIWDVAQAVDHVLEGNGYIYETRQWDVNTLGVVQLR
ncbi:unnamed protein product [Peronospora farinosa]|uniref:AAA+ ATPase domain-containing protein n=1 Tax=Peronospora farinosa TaxID=134698 RepID=A0AAV0SR31_9STRA|nr:unnamed protein product [Peronospora farinosa]CAI5706278.1 unnamed protein product [Peronospora farinosa]